MSSSESIDLDELFARVGGIRDVQMLGSVRSSVFRARAFHVSTQQNVLLYLATSPENFPDLDRIARMLRDCEAFGLGSVIDRRRSAEDDERPWRALMTPWYENSNTLDSELRTRGEQNSSPSSLSIISVLRDVATQMRELHRLGYVHRDISLSNIIVTPDGAGHLIDLEFAGPAKASNEQAPQSWPFTPHYGPASRTAALTTGDYNADDERRWDRYALGKVILQIRSITDPYSFAELTLFTQRTLQMVAGLLLGREINAGEAALGLPVQFYVQDEYGCLDPLISVLSRLLRDRSHSLIEELAPIQSSVVEVGATRPAPFTDRVRKLLETPAMQQLATCQQLGLISYIWPSANHSRLEHALGTFATACEAMRNLLEDPQSPIMLVLGSDYVQSTFLAAALLHDVGHFPLAHDFEEALPGAFHHESRSVAAIESEPISVILEAPRQPSGLDFAAPRTDDSDSALERSGWGVRAADVAAVVTGRARSGGTFTDWVATLLHSILSGALDVDKLDYLVRDSQRLHVAAGGGIDVGRVLSSMTVAVVDLPDEERRELGEEIGMRLAVRSKGARPAELVGRVRSHMFGVVYWHHSYRSIKAMMHWIAWDSIGAGGQDEDGVRRAGERLAISLDRALSGSDSSALFDHQSMLPGFERMWEEAPRIPYREAGVLHFLAAGGGGDSSEMMHLLETRKWFHSVLTLEHPDNVEVSGPDALGKEIWEWVSVMQERSSEYWIKARVQWALILQRKLLSALHSASPPLTVVLQKDEMLSRIAEASKSQIVLIDTVEVRKSKDKPLYVVQSERSNSRRELTTTRMPVRRSYDQYRLSQDFVAANGAIRVLAHPEYFSFIERVLSRDAIAELLRDSMLEVERNPRRRRRSVPTRSRR